jgi:hypothetical protein
MSVIPTVYNQGTGLIGSTTEGSSIPSTIEDLVVQNTLTVIGTTNLVADVTCDATLTAETLAATTLQVDDVIIDDLVVQNATVQDTATVETLITQELGGSNTTTFSLPVQNGTDNQVLAILDDTATPITTEWKDDSTVDDYVSYDTTSNKLQNNETGVLTTIDELDIDTIMTQELGGSNNTTFSLPVQNGTDNQVLAILDDTATPITTEWKDDSTVDDYVSYDTTSNKLQNNETGVLTTIDELDIDTIITQEIGSTTTETFSLPSSNGTDNQVLAILDDTATPITTEWKDDNTIDNYVRYSTVSNQLIDEDGGVATTIATLRTTTNNITSLNVGDLAGQDGEARFVRDDNVNGVARNQVLSFSNPNSLDNSIQLVSFANTTNFTLEISINPTDEKILISSSSLNISNTIEITSDYVAIKSDNVLIDSGGGFIKLPSNTPTSNETIRFSGFGNGTTASPYTSTYSV